jgi:hypothetical protein
MKDRKGINELKRDKIIKRMQIEDLHKIIVKN